MSWADSAVRVWGAAALAAFLTTLLVYGPTANAYFLSDDFVLIGDASRGRLLQAWGPFLRPLVVFSYAIDYRVWGFEPLGFHLTNLLFHTASALGVASLAFQLSLAASLERTRASWLAGSAATLFLLLPCHSEVVAWISGRGDSLATAFALLSLTTFVHFLRSGRNTSLIGTGVSFAAALLSKEPAATLPALSLVFGLALAMQRVANRRLLLNRTLIAMGVLLATLAVYFCIRKFMLGSFVTTDYLVFEARTIALNAVTICVRLIASPEFAPEIHRLVKLPWVWGVLGVAGVTALIVVALRASRGEQLLLVAVTLVFATSLLPILSLGVSLYDTQGERHLYFPSAFVCIGIAAVCFSVLRRLWLALPVLGLFAAFSALALPQLSDNWAEAGRLSRSVADSINSAGTDTRVFVINAPDNYRGAYVFRNGLAEAASTFSPDHSISELKVLLTHTVHDLDQPFRMISDGKPGKYRLCGLRANAVVLPMEYAKTAVRDCLRVSMPTIDRDVAVFLFSEGNVVRVGRGADSRLRFTEVRGS